MSSSRPRYSDRSTWLNGSRRPPKRDLVLRTPLATALTSPSPWVRTTTMRSPSPSFQVRSTTPGSRQRFIPLVLAGSGEGQVRLGVASHDHRHPPAHALGG